MYNVHGIWVIFVFIKHFHRSSFQNFSSQCFTVARNSRYFFFIFQSNPNFICFQLCASLNCRGADPNDIDNKGTTPLMIAAKLGRDDNIGVLMSVTISEDEAESDKNDEDDEMEGELKLGTDGGAKRVNINAKHRKTAKTPLHYAAKNGHEVCYFYCYHWYIL